jgi:hypothetical protein
MKELNEVVLVAIAIVALISLVIEMEDRRNYRHEFLLKISFGSLAVGALAAVFYETIYCYTFMNLCFLAVLITRLISRKKI